MQHAVAGARHQRPAVEVHAADAFGRPVRIAAEQRVVLRRAQEAHDAKLLHQLVDQLLGAGLVELALGDVALEVDVEEGRDAADRHGRAVGLLDGAEIAEIGPLHRLARGLGRPGEVAVVAPAHLDQVAQRPHLLGHLLAQPNDVLARPHLVDLGALGLLGLQQPVDAVQRHPPVVADDAAAAIGIGQAGDDVRPRGSA